MAIDRVTHRSYLPTQFEDIGSTHGSWQLSVTETRMLRLAAEFLRSPRHIRSLNKRRMKGKAVLGGVRASLLMKLEPPVCRAVRARCNDRMINLV